jgi:hypothetical protein
MANSTPLSFRIPPNKRSQKAFFGFPCVSNSLLTEPHYPDSRVPSAGSPKSTSFSTTKSPCVDAQSGIEGLLASFEGVGRSKRTFLFPIRRGCPSYRWMGGELGGTSTGTWGIGSEGVKFPSGGGDSSCLGAGVTRSDETRTSSAPMRNRKSRRRSRVPDMDPAPGILACGCGQLRSPPFVRIHHPLPPLPSSSA